MDSGDEQAFMRARIAANDCNNSAVRSADGSLEAVDIFVIECLRILWKTVLINLWLMKKEITWCRIT